MSTFPAMSPPQAAIDVLLTLLDAEQGSAFNFLDQSWPHLTRASVEMRGRLEQMSASAFGHGAALADLIESLGGQVGLRLVQPADQYMAFLTLEFLIPEFIQAKQLLITQYQNAISAIGGASPQAVALLNSHLADHRADLQFLQHAGSP